MKATIKVFFIAIFLLSFNKISNAQIEENCQVANIDIGIPIILDHYEANLRGGEVTNEKHIPDKPGRLGLRFRVVDMKVEGNSFSGIHIMKHGGKFDIQTIYGKVSEGKQMMDYIEISRDNITYSSSDRQQAYLQTRRTVSSRIEDIPVYAGSYKYKHGQSKIISAEYKNDYVKKYLSGAQTTRDRMVKINEGKINQYTPIARVNFTKGTPDIAEHDSIIISVGVRKPSLSLGKDLGSSIISQLMKFRAPMYSIVLESVVIDEGKDEASINNREFVDPETGKTHDGSIKKPDIEITVVENRIPEDKTLPLEIHSLKVLIKSQGETTEIIPDDINDLKNFPHQIFIKVLEIMSY